MPAFLGTKYRIFWSKMETVNSLEEIQHAGVKACLEYMGIDEGFEINHAGDLPARSGLGSSSAFTVGMLNALHALRGEYASKDRLASEAIEVEQEVLKETVGVQDQIECAYGGLNLLEIRPDGEFSVHPVILTEERKLEFEDHCLLFFTGLQRHASEIAQTQMENYKSKAAQLRDVAALVPIGVKALTEGSLYEFGRLLNWGWVCKRGLSAQMSNPDLDALYQSALDAGAWGGKLLGAGGGGFLLLFVAPEYQAAVRAAMGELFEVPFRFESCGTQIVLS